MKTKYIKVAVSERLTEKEANYTVKRIVTYDNSNNYHSMQYFNGCEISKRFWDAHIEYWLEEVPDREQEMRDMLDECRLQLEHLNKPDRGTTNSVLSRLNTLLNSIK